ncbi:MAG: contractile injection system tape measure protein [Microscillaceae bacterium]|nr:contractile injection system tape measure protein [Microscillaceae bacterium]
MQAKPQNHLVNKVRLLLEVESEALALRVRKEWAKTLETRLSEIIDRVCTQNLLPEEWLKIDRLEIDLGALTPEDISQKWVSLFEVAFEKKIKEQRTQTSLQERQALKEHSDLETLLFFLEKGYLPWWAQSQSLDLDGLLQELIDKQVVNLKTALQETLRKPQAFKRLIYQINIPILLALLSNGGLSQQEVQVWILPLLQKVKNAIDSESTIYKGSNQIFQLLISNMNQAQTWQVLAYLLEQSILGNTAIQDLLSAEEKIPLFLEEILKQSPKLIQTTEKETTIQKRDLEIIQAAEHLYIQQAGLVLLAPFLPAFFRATDLLDSQSQFKSAEAQQYAVYLLHELATGDAPLPEFSLVLEKLLCGMPFEEAIPTEIKITESHQKEALLLLEEVIGHWTALKSSNPRELREAFLKRAGSIEAKGLGEWLIRVERQTWDILLEKIPWGFSLLKLPWTNNLIHVIW